MGGLKKKKAKRGIEHHKRSLEETLEAPETYGVRVSEGTSCEQLPPAFSGVKQCLRCIGCAQTKTRPAKRRKAAASAAADEAAENEEVAVVV